MSIAALSAKHYNAVFTTLAERAYYGKHKNRSLRPLGYIASENHLRDKCQNMATLNYRCFGNRYEDGFDGYSPKVKKDRGLLSDIELLKAVQAINYQIELEYSEAATKDELAAYEFFQEIEDSLLRIIVGIYADRRFSTRGSDRIKFLDFRPLWGNRKRGD